MKSFFNKFDPNIKLKLSLFFKYNFKRKEFNEYEFIQQLKKYYINVEKIDNFNSLVDENCYFRLFGGYYAIVYNDIAGNFIVSYAYVDKTYILILDIVELTLNDKS